MENFFGILFQAFEPFTLFMSVIGVIVGLIVGATPGLGPVMALSVLLPFTFKMPALPSLALMAAIYVGANAGDAIPAVLIGVPGTAGAAADVLDGYPLAEQGRGTEALNISIIGSFIGGTFSTLILLLFAGPLVSVSVNFGPPEYFWLACCGLSIIAVLSSGTMIKGLISGALGVGISAIGIDLTYGFVRFTFDNPNLLEGIPLLPILLGLFAISRTLEMVQEGIFNLKLSKTKLFDLELPSLSVITGLKKTFFRASIIGTFIGILPGAGANIAGWMAYGEEKRSSKNSEKFGKGAIEGLAAAETANSAVTGGAMLPLLCLGIPGSPTTAVMYAGITVQGLAPGLDLFSKYSDLVYALIVGLFIANLATLIIGLFLRTMISRLLGMTPGHILTVAISVASILGAYSIENNMFHVYTMLFFGAMGFALKKIHVPVAPIVLGVILGPMMEVGLRQSLDLFGTNYWMIFTGNRGISIIFVLLLIFILFGRTFWNHISKRWMI